MSDTPRTDAIQLDAEAKFRDGEWRQFSRTEAKGWELARQLERELAEAKTVIESGRIIIKAKDEALDADLTRVADLQAKAQTAHRAEQVALSDEELHKRWNSVWLKANEDAQAEMFAQESLPADPQAAIQKLALRKCIIAFARGL
jgi:hypothetical protein